MQNNAQMLEILLSSANRQDLYSADGQAAPATTRRIIDSA
jgi:flagellar biosynthesis/type III secretory pathway chaperone